MWVLGDTVSIEHLELLRNALERSKWLVVNELPGNDYDISAYWEVARPNGIPKFTIAFLGIDDLKTLPIEKAYGCHVVGRENIGCYFGRVNKSYKEELDNFIKVVVSEIT